MARCSRTVSGQRRPEGSGKEDRGATPAVRPGRNYARQRGRRWIGWVVGKSDVGALSAFDRSSYESGGAVQRQPDGGLVRLRGLFRRLSVRLVVSNNANTVTHNAAKIPVSALYKVLLSYYQPAKILIRLQFLVCLLFIFWDKC
jgi:hypothetical protein